MKKGLLWGAVLLTVINITTLAMVGYHRWGRSGTDETTGRNRGTSMSWERELGLSEEQYKQTEARRDTLGQKIRPLREALNLKRDTFYQLMADAQTDRPAIDGLQNQMDSLQIEIKRLVVEHMLEQKGSLTPEQQQKFFSQLKKRFYDGDPGRRDRNYRN